MCPCPAVLRRAILAPSSPVGLDCSRVPYPLFSLSPHVYPSIVFPGAVFLLCVGAPLRSFRLVVADPRGGAHHRKCDLPTYTAVGKNNVECGIIMEDLLPSVKYSTLW